MTKKRPFGITILAVLVGLGALLAVYHTLQFLHVLPFSLGPIRFFTFDLFGALLWGIDAAILIWLVTSLWNLRLEGWLFVVVIAVINLILAFLSILGQSSFAAMFPAILINVLILIYCLTPGVKAAFQPVAPPAPATAAPAAVSSAAAGAPAPAVRAAPLEIPLEEEPAPIPEPALAAAPPEVAAPVALVSEAFEEAAAEPESAVPAAPPVESRAAEVPAPAPVSRHRVPVDTIEGIGPVYAARLKEIGLLYVDELLQAGASRLSREELVEKTGISSALVLKWVNMADLMRISGVGEEYSELLEAAGVDTVKELRHRNPENLHQAMQQANEHRKMVRRLPHLSEVQSWVEQAKGLEPVITY